MLHLRYHRQPQRRDVHQPVDLSAHPHRIADGFHGVVSTRFPAWYRADVSCHGLGLALCRIHAGHQTGLPPPIHDAGFLPQSDAAGTGHDLGGRTYDLAGGTGHTGSQPRQVRSLKIAAPYLWRLCPARRNDALVLGNIWRGNDSGLGHDRDQPSRHTLAESLKAIPDRIIRRSAVREYCQGWSRHAGTGN